MLNFSPSIRIYLHAKPVDMRKSFDGLFGIIVSDFQMDVRDGGLFLFINHRRNRIKLFYWDNDGCAIWMKRLERGCYQYPRHTVDDKRIVMDATELNLLLSGIELSSVKKRTRYVAPKRIAHTNEAQA